jgi:hypothetical protein
VTWIGKPVKPPACFWRAAVLVVLLFAGSAYLDANEAPKTPEDLRNRPSLFMMRTGIAPVWRLRRSGKAEDEMVMP